MSKTSVIYKDVAVGADEDAATTVTGASSDSQTAKLPFGVENEPIITTEKNAWTLGGTKIPKGNQPIALWSSDISGADCTFENAPEITFAFDQQYSALGVSVQFDEDDSGWGAVNIKWYQGTTLKSEKSFIPDSSLYFCSNKVTAFDKIVMTFPRTLLPKQWLKINEILFGIVRTFDMDELREASITNEMSLSGLELPESSFTWTLESKNNIDFMFQLKQPVTVKNNGKSIGVYYVDSSRRDSNSKYKITCHDAFGVLSEVQFDGGAYLSGISALTLLQTVVGDSFGIICTAEDTTLYGLLKPQTKREAIQQIIFAWGVCASTDADGKIHVFKPTETATTISADVTYTGVSVETNAITTSVKVIGHTYTTTASTTGIEINGTYYKDTKTPYTVQNPNVTASDKENVVTVEDATLVSTHNGQAIAQRLYDFYLKRNAYTGRIVWNGEKLGDLLTMQNAWDGTHTGTIERMEFILSNTVAVQCKNIGI